MLAPLLRHNYETYLHTCELTMSDTDTAPPKGKPSAPQFSDSEVSESGYRSRSQSRRSRRRKAQAKPKEQGKPDENIPAIQEDDAEQEQAQTGAMQKFQRIGPDETSMDGPVTYARAQRGEIPMRPGNPNQKMKTAGDVPNYQQGKGQQMQSKEDDSDKLMEQDGLKLRIELNLDIEVELKASIHGDLTLALL